MTLSPHGRIGELQVDVDNRKYRVVFPRYRFPSRPHGVLDVVEVVTFAAGQFDQGPRLRR